MSSATDGIHTYRVCIGATPRGSPPVVSNTIYKGEFISKKSTKQNIKL